jgi:hypothetical protein
MLLEIVAGFVFCVVVLGCVNNVAVVGLCLDSCPCEIPQDQILSRVKSPCKVLSSHVSTGGMNRSVRFDYNIYVHTSHPKNHLNCQNFSVNVFKATTVVKWKVI